MSTVLLNRGKTYLANLLVGACPPPNMAYVEYYNGSKNSLAAPALDPSWDITHFQNLPSGHWYVRVPIISAAVSQKDSRTALFSAAVQGDKSEMAPGSRKPSVGQSSLFYACTLVYAPDMHDPQKDIPILYQLHTANGVLTPTSLVQNTSMMVTFTLNLG